MSDAAPQRLLVVDDDSDLSELIAGFLRDHHYEVETAADAAGMDAALRRGRFDCVVLDLMMPGEDGLSVLRRLRARDATPVIMLSAMGEDVDRIVGLEVGADDYLAKPCNPRELLARVRALLRRVADRPPADAPPGTPRRRFGDWSLDLVERVLARANYPDMALTDAEFRILTRVPRSLAARAVARYADRARQGFRRRRVRSRDRRDDQPAAQEARPRRSDPHDPQRRLHVRAPPGRRVMRFRSLPIFWQTLGLLLGGLVIAQIISVLLIMLLPAPRPDFYTMSEIAEALVDEPGITPQLRITRRIDAPPIDGSMIAQAPLTERLAKGLGRPPSDIRLFFEADQSGTFPFNRNEGRGAVPIKHGQPYFFNTVVAALRLPGGGWRVVRTPPPPLMSGWQQRTALWFGVSALAMLPFAFGFARALTRPIRSFAAAVERLDHDDAAPPVPVAGPRELRLAAVAVNDMQRNLHGFVRERTAMIGAIAHDLRTPLARIAFRIERAPDAVREPVFADIEQMRAMIATTIAFVRDGTAVGERRPVEIAGLARRLADQARDTGSAVALGTLEPVTIAGDRPAIERLVQNLIDNAVKYAGAAELSVAHAADAARVCVADRGPGIPDGELDRMFEPFARIDPSRSRSTGGIGLGLAIARSIAQAHGGSIVAANRPGGGLAVTVELPVAA